MTRRSERSLPQMRHVFDSDYTSCQLPDRKEPPRSGRSKPLLGARRLGQAPDALDDLDRFQHAGYYLPGARSLSLVAEPLFEQLGVRETNAQLVVQPVEETRQLRVGRGHVLMAGSRRRLRAVRQAFCPTCGLRRIRRITPERVDEDADGAAGCPDVFNFSAGDPVVDRSTADTYEFTRTRNGNSLSV